MINNKNQLKKALKENKNNIKIKRIYNQEKDDKNILKILFIGRKTLIKGQ